LRQYQQKQDSSVSHDLIAALREVQESAKRTGLDKLTAREIDAEITARRRQHANKTKQTVR
jgi:hypothetical protein